MLFRSQGSHGRSHPAIPASCVPQPTRAAPLPGLTGGRFFGDAKTRRMPTVRRVAQPKMVKVRGGISTSKAPVGFGLDPEEIDQFNSKAAAELEADRM